MASHLFMFYYIFQMCAKLKMMPPSVFLAWVVDSYRRRWFSMHFDLISEVKITIIACQGVEKVIIFIIVIVMDFKSDDHRCWWQSGFKKHKKGLLWVIKNWESGTKKQRYLRPNLEKSTSHKNSILDDSFSCNCS